jgi:hypothetical protein
MFGELPRTTEKENMPELDRKYYVPKKQGVFAGRIH